MKKNQIEKKLLVFAIIALIALGLLLPLLGGPIAIVGHLILAASGAIIVFLVLRLIYITSQQKKACDSNKFIAVGIFLLAIYGGYVLFNHRMSVSVQVLLPPGISPIILVLDDLAILINVDDKEYSNVKREARFYRRTAPGPWEITDSIAQNEGIVAVESKFPGTVSIIVGPYNIEYKKHRYIAVNKARASLPLGYPLLGISPIISVPEDIEDDKLSLFNAFK